MDKFCFNAAESLVNNKNLKSLFKKLIDFFAENAMFFELAGLYECLYRLDDNIEYLKKEAFVIDKYLGNNYLSLQLNLLYLKNFDTFLYENLKKNLIVQGFKFEEIENYNQNDKNSYNLVKIADRYNILLYIIKYFVKLKKYNTAIDLIPYMDKFESEILNYIEKNQPKDLICLEHLKNYKNELSVFLSNVKNHNDINNLAIRLNNLNEVAYLNIVDDFITYENYEQALNFFNDIFAPKFSIEPKSTIISICWFLSDKYYARELYFDSIRFQKIAIEQELSN